MVRPGDFIQYQELFSTPLVVKVDQAGMDSGSLNIEGQLYHIDNGKTFGQKVEFTINSDKLKFWYRCSDPTNGSKSQWTSLDRSDTKWKIPFHTVVGGKDEC